MIQADTGTNNQELTGADKRASGGYSYPCRIKSEAYGTDERPATKGARIPVSSSLVK